jgi:hypothetical protein
MTNRSERTLIVDAPSLEIWVNAREDWLLDCVSDIFSAGLPISEPVESVESKSVQTYEVSLEVDESGNPRWRADSGNERIFDVSSHSELVTGLENAISNTLARSLDGFQLIHSGALIRNGHGILIPGASGAGKSTTTAAFALSGFQYCTDDVAVFGSDRKLRPFPKVLALKPPGWKVISANYPESQKSVIFRADDDGVTYLRAPLLPDDTTSMNGVPIDLILLPRKDDVAAPAIEKISKSDVIRVLTEESLDLQILRSTAFDGLIDIVREAECYALNVLDLPAAVEAVKNLTE